VKKTIVKTVSIAEPVEKEGVLVAPRRNRVRATRNRSIA
jgi:hypothetical protein